MGFASGLGAARSLTVGELVFGVDPRVPVRKLSRPSLTGRDGVGTRINLAVEGVRGETRAERSLRWRQHLGAQ